MSNIIKNDLFGSTDGGFADQVRASAAIKSAGRVVQAGSGNHNAAQPNAAIDPQSAALAQKREELKSDHLLALLTKQGENKKLIAVLLLLSTMQKQGLWLYSYPEILYASDSSTVLHNLLMVQLWSQLQMSTNAQLSHTNIIRLNLQHAIQQAQPNATPQRIIEQLQGRVENAPLLHGELNRTVEMMRQFTKAHPDQSLPQSMALQIQAQLVPVVENAMQNVQKIAAQDPLNFATQRVVAEIIQSAPMRAQEPIQNLAKILQVQNIIQASSLNPDLPPLARQELVKLGQQLEAAIQAIVPETFAQQPVIQSIYSVVADQKSVPQTAIEIRTESIKMETAPTVAAFMERSARSEAIVISPLPANRDLGVVSAEPFSTQIPETVKHLILAGSLDIGDKIIPPAERFVPRDTVPNELVKGSATELGQQILSVSEKIEQKSAVPSTANFSVATKADIDRPPLTVVDHVTGPIKIDTQRIEPKAESKPYEDFPRPPIEKQQIAERFASSNLVQPALVRAPDKILDWQAGNAGMVYSPAVARELRQQVFGNQSSKGIANIGPKLRGLSSMGHPVGCSCPSCSGDVNMTKYGTAQSKAIGAGGCSITGGKCNCSNVDPTALRGSKARAA